MFETEEVLVKRVMYKCPTCQFMSDSQSKLLKHIEKKHPKKKYQCPICHKWYAEKKNVNRHLKEVHAKIKPYKCEICHERFWKKHTLAAHMASHHSESVAEVENVTEVAPESSSNVSDQSGGSCEISENGTNEKACGSDSPLMSPFLSPSVSPSVCPPVKISTVPAVSGVIEGNKMLLTVILPN